jgi:enoyl-CoA hydratase/carnithine racemase
MIDYRVEGRVAYLTLDRPEKLNALTDEGILELIRRLRELDKDERADIGVVSGNGRAFSSGADVKERLLVSATDGVDSQYRPSEADAVLRCANWKPLIAAVHGYALGHSFHTALLCDFVVASEDARFQVTETAIGVPSGGTWHHIAQATGTAFASDVVFTGRMFTAREAYEARLITRLVPAGSHLDAARVLADELLQHPQGAIREMVRVRRSVLAEQLQHARSIAGTYRWDLSSGFQEAIRAKADG